MEILTTYLQNIYPFLFKWQSLFGAIIGVFGAVSVTFLGIYIKKNFQKRDEIKESIRQTEIALALGLNDLYDAERHFLDFIDRLKEVVLQPLQNNQHPGQYFLNRTNFPPISIHIDSSLLKSKHRSYYVHNKILIIYKNIKMANKVYGEMGVEYEKILETAKDLIRGDSTPENQQREYLKNNESFKSFIEDAVDQLQIAKKIFVQTKVYNLKLLSKQRFSVWKLEGINFKFFCNKKEIEKYKSTLQCLDRIDKEIKNEVIKLMKESEDRQNNINQNNTKKSFKECLKCKYKLINSNFKKKY